MRVLVAMSGGVDSSVAAALLKEEGHEVVGATLKLWGGRSDSGCCSAADVADARRVADHLGLDHHVFNLTEAFGRAVVDPYVAAHREGRTPNPCVECNRHLKFGLLLERARRLGFDAVATGHHARVCGKAPRRLLRGRDGRKDQSYVLAVLTAAELAELVLPVGELDKAEVRERARALGLRTADKPDSQEVCFIPRHGDGAGRKAFLGERMALHPGRLLDTAGEEVGRVDALELVTVGQRRGLGAPARERRFALSVDIVAGSVLVGPRPALDADGVELEQRTWTKGPLRTGSKVDVQTSAHGLPVAAFLTDRGVRFAEPARRVAPGQLVALYRGEEVVGSGVAR